MLDATGDREQHQGRTRADQAGDSEWPPEAIATLTRLWNEGRLSAAEIGAEIGVSKNAVVGKARRLKLLRKESPIRRSRPPEHLLQPERKYQQPPRRDCAAPSDHAVALRRSDEKGAEARLETPTPARPRAFVPDPARRAIDTSTIRSRCAFPLWPHGEKPTGQYCGHDTNGASPYCLPHTRRCAAKIVPKPAKHPADA